MLARPPAADFGGKGLPGRSLGLFLAFVSAVPDIVALHEEMTAWRRHLHANPETAFEEVETAEFVSSKLRSFGLEVATGIARTGVVGSLSRGSGRSVGLRADMDALNILEGTALPYASVRAGKMHACGHDGHTAMLLGAARYLSRSSTFSGTVRFIFQPAEENEGGARAMVEEGLFDRFPVDAVFALHNWPGVEAGTFGVRAGPVMASFDTFDIEIVGRGCHAAMPHLGRDPLLAASAVLQALQQIVSRGSNPLDSVVVSVTQMHGGDAYNVIPERCVLRGTVRAFRQKDQERAEESIHRIADGIAAAGGCEVVVTYERRYPATVNDPASTQFAAAVAAQVVGPQAVVLDMPPSMGSEDFAFMLQQRPGCYMRLGNGSAEGGRVLHSPHFDFNDAILPIGASYLARVAESFLTETS